MPKKRTFKCPKCGTLNASQARYFFICGNCGETVKISDEYAHEKPAETLKAPLKKIKVKKKEVVTMAEEAPKDAKETEEYECNECGAPLKKGQKYCPACGYGELQWDAE